MEHKNPLFDCFRHVNLVSDYKTPRAIIDAVIDGMTFSMMHMFETVPVVYAHYIEDYGLSHRHVGMLPPSARIMNDKTSHIFGHINTNVYLCHDSCLISQSDSTVGSCLTSYSCYPALRTIDIPVNALNELSHNPQRAIRHIAAHETLQMHPLYEHKHCDNPDCLMFPGLWPRIPAHPFLCQRCLNRLRRFNSDMKFRHRITNRVMLQEMYIHILKSYPAIYHNAVQRSQPGTKTAITISKILFNNIKKYYRELWLDIPR